MPLQAGHQLLVRGVRPTSGHYIGGWRLPEPAR